MPLRPEIRASLQRVSTATIATALFKPGFRIQCIQGVQPLHPVHESMVGEAVTLRTIPAREDLNSLEVFRDPDHPQRKLIEEFPAGAVVVIDSRKDARAASAGAITAEASEMTAYEDFAAERVAAGASIRGLYPATDPRNLELFAEWRRAKGR